MTYALITTPAGSRPGDRLRQAGVTGNGPSSARPRQHLPLAVAPPSSPRASGGQQDCRPLSCRQAGWGDCHDNAGHRDSCGAQAVHRGRR